MSAELNAQHLLYLEHALGLAALRRGFCAPNPAVGAVVVDDEGGLLGAGYHRAAGEAHAEVHAIQQAGELARGATLYVTLEPCCHHGKTPPCTDLIIRSGIKRVFYAYRDLNPAVAEKSSAVLANAGITSEYVFVAAVTDFYRSYAYWWQHKRPFVTAKLALSADGKIAGADGKPIAITGDEARQFTHQCRLRSDAILTTAKTILHDDPQLNVRLEKATFSKPIYVLDTHVRLPSQATIFNTAQSITLFYAKPSEHIKQFVDQGVRCILVDSDRCGLNLSQVMDHIGQDGVHDVWVEAGGQCLQSLLQAQLLNQLYLYVSNETLGESATPAFRQSFSPWLSRLVMTWKTLGDDNLLSISELDESCQQESGCG